MRARHRALARIGQDEAAVLGATTLTWEEDCSSSSPPLLFQEEHVGEILISGGRKKKTIHLTYSLFLFFLITL